MRLIEITEALKHIALAQPSIRTVVPNDVYRLNTLPDVQYGVFSFVQGNHRSDNENFMHYYFTLFYVDRLTENKGNEIEVQSTGIDTLMNIIRGMEEKYTNREHQTVTFTTFTERFSDECAGAFATVDFMVPASTICEEEY